MRKLAALATLATLALPGAAAAHHDYRAGSTQPIATFISPSPPTLDLACWQTAGLAPGQTFYLDGPNVHNWGLAEAFDWTHFHPLNGGPTITGNSTKFWWGSDVALASRFMVDRAGDYFVKWVHQGGTVGAAIRKNC